MASKRGPRRAGRPPLSLGEMLDLPFRILLWAPPQLAANLVRAALAILRRRLPPRPFLACAAVRMFLRVFSPRQIQLLVPATLDVYRAFVRSSRPPARGGEDIVEVAVPPAGGETGEADDDDEDVPPPARLLWLGDRATATRFVYFLHGGGYVAPALRGHFEWCRRAYVDEGGDGDGGGGVAVAVLEYTLAPGAKFPTQLRQAAAGLALLLREGRGGDGGAVRPSQVVVGGDSAGGNLALQLLAHLLHRHPAAAAVPLAGVGGGDEGAGEPLAGAFLVSPLASGALGAGGSLRGGGLLPCDMLSPAVLRDPGREMFHEPRGGVGGWLRPNRGLVETRAFREGRDWALVGDAPDEWLAGLGAVVRKVYVTCGRHELLRDQGVAVAEKIRRRNGDVDVRLEVAEKEAHDFILLEGEMREVGDATVRMRNWFSYVWE